MGEGIALLFIILFCYQSVITDFSRHNQTWDSVGYCMDSHTSKPEKPKIYTSKTWNLYFKSCLFILQNSEFILQFNFFILQISNYNTNFVLYNVMTHWWQSINISIDTPLGWFSVLYVRASLRRVKQKINTKCCFSDVVNGIIKKCNGLYFKFIWFIPWNT